MSMALESTNPLDKQIRHAASRYLVKISGVVDEEKLRQFVAVLTGLQSAISRKDDEKCREDLSKFKKLHQEIQSLGQHALSDPGNGIITMTTAWWESRNGRE